MVDQLSFSSLDYAAKQKRTKPDVFLAEMAVVAWAALKAVIDPHYPKGGRKAAGDRISSSSCCASMRAFACLELGRDAIPDETTILNEEGNLRDRCRHRGEGRVAAAAPCGATLIAVSPSTKCGQQRDPEMSQSKKGNQWYFGMKAHIGVDAESGLVHTDHGQDARREGDGQFDPRG